MLILRGIVSRVRLVLVLVETEWDALRVASVWHGGLYTHGLCPGSKLSRTAPICAISAGMLLIWAEALCIISRIEARGSAEGLVGVSGLVAVHALRLLMALGRVVAGGLVLLAVLVVCHDRRRMLQCDPPQSLSSGWLSRCGCGQPRRLCSCSDPAVQSSAGLLNYCVFYNVNAEQEDMVTVNEGLVWRRWRGR